MSMNVYAMDYSNLQQNDTKSTTQKTDKEDMKRTELQQNVGSVRVTQEKYREDGTISMVQRMQGTEVYRRAKDGRGDTDELQGAGVTRQYSGDIRRDTAIISEEGRRAYSQMSRQQEGVEKQSTLSTEAGINEKQDMLSTKTGMNEKQDTAPEEAENTKKDLSEYTDTELKQMYYRGEITLQEYEDETGEVID